MEGLLFTLTAIVLFVVILGGLVLVHEVGHYVTARLFDVRVLEFGVGFPPRARILRQKGETMWTLNWLPIGGFVRLEGEDGDGSGDPRSFAGKPLRARLAILAAGSAMNIALAFAIFFAIALFATPVVGVRIGQVETGSPAAAAGLQAGDEIYGVSGETFSFFGPRSLVDGLRSRAGESVTLDVRRADGSRATLTATLRPAAELSPTRGALGIGQLSQSYSGTYVGHDPGTSIAIAADQLARWGGLILDGLGQLVGGFVRDPTTPPPASGPIGIAVSLADIFLRSGPVLTLFVAGILSVNLGVVNILPFPPLDGGRMAVLVLKRLVGPRVSLRAERLTYAVGFLFLIVFIIWVTSFDILRLGGTP